MTEFKTNSDLLWATLNKLIRESLNYNETDKNFEIGSMVMDQLALEDHNVLKTVWACVDSSGSGELAYHGVKINSIKSSYEDCLNIISKDANYKDDEYLKNKLKKSTDIPDDSYENLLIDTASIVKTVNEWKQDVIKESDCTTIKITNAEGKISNISAGGNFGGNVQTSVVSGDININGDVKHIEFGEGDEPATDVWMELTFAKTRTFPTKRRNWFDYDYLDSCTTDIVDATKTKLEKFWKDGKRDPETQVLTSEPGAFCYIPTNLVIWQGIKVRFGFTTGHGNQTLVEGTMHGNLKIFGVNGIEATAKVRVNVSSGELYDYEFDSGKITNTPFIAGVIVESPKLESIRGKLQILHPLQAL